MSIRKALMQSSLNLQAKLGSRTYSAIYTRVVPLQGGDPVRELVGDVLQHDVQHSAQFPRSCDVPQSPFIGLPKFQRTYWFVVGVVFTRLEGLAHGVLGVTQMWLLVFIGLAPFRGPRHDRYLKRATAV